MVSLLSSWYGEGIAVALTAGAAHDDEAAELVAQKRTQDGLGRAC